MNTSSNNISVYAKRKYYNSKIKKHNLRMKRFTIGVYLLTIFVCLLITSDTFNNAVRYSTFKYNEFILNSSTPVEVIERQHFYRDLEDVEYDPVPVTFEMMERYLYYNELDDVYYTTSFHQEEKSILEVNDLDLLEYENNNIEVVSSSNDSVEGDIDDIYINPNAIPSGIPENRYFGWSEEDYKWLLRVIVGESQNCSRDEQLDTGSVVLNRLYNDKYFKYANSIENVVLATGQYTSFIDGNAYRTPTNTNIEVTMQLLKEGPISPSNVIFQSLEQLGDGVYKYYPDTGTYICYKN